MISARKSTRGKARTIPEPLARLSAADLSRLILAIGGAYAFPRVRRAKRKIRRSDLTQCKKVVEVAIRHVIPWPGAFERDMHELLRRRTREKSMPMAKVFFRLYRPLVHEVKELPFEFLREAFGDFVGKWWNEPLNRRHRIAVTNSGDVLVQVSAAARLFHMRGSTLKLVCRAAGIQPDARNPQQGRRARHFLSASDLSQIRAWLGDLISIREAANFLGVSRPRVRELIRDGELEQVMLQRSRVQLEKKLVATWFRSFADVATPMPRKSGLVAFPFALRHAVPRGAFQSLVHTLRNGAAPLYFDRAKPKSFRDLLLHAQMFERRRSISHSPTHFTVPEAALRLGIKQEVAYSLTRSGLLACEPRQLGRRRSSAVSAESICHFTQRYISAIELAKRLGTSPRAIIAKLASHGALPVAGPGIDDCRQVFYSRERVAKLTDRW